MFGVLKLLPEPGVSAFKGQGGSNWQSSPSFQDRKRVLPSTHVMCALFGDLKPNVKALKDLIDGLGTLTSSLVWGLGSSRLPKLGLRFRVEFEFTRCRSGVEGLFWVPDSESCKVVPYH